MVPFSLPNIVASLLSAAAQTVTLADPGSEPRFKSDAITGLGVRRVVPGVAALLKLTGKDRDRLHRGAAFRECFFNADAAESARRRTASAPSLESPDAWLQFP